MGRGGTFSTPTGIHFDAAAVRLDDAERRVLYAIAEHQLLASPCAQLRGDERLCRAAERLVRMGFIDATHIGWDGHRLTVCARVKPEGEVYLTHSPLDGAVVDGANRAARRDS